jgi:hypothetical protein
MTHPHHDIHTGDGERLDQASPALAIPTGHGIHADHPTTAPITTAPITMAPARW